MIDRGLNESFSVQQYNRPSHILEDYKHLRHRSTIQTDKDARSDNDDHINVMIGTWVTVIPYLAMNSTHNSVLPREEFGAS